MVDMGPALEMGSLRVEIWKVCWVWVLVVRERWEVEGKAVGGGGSILAGGRLRRFGRSGVFRSFLSFFVVFSGEGLKGA